LLAADFDFDMQSYSVALKFLSDLSGGTVETDALTQNGGSIAMLRSWERSQKFRRVLAKCRAAGATEREATAKRDAEKAEEKKRPDTVGSQVFVPILDMPVNPKTFVPQPRLGSWGR
jgi:hypothetical protein